MNWLPTKEINTNCKISFHIHKNDKVKNFWQYKEFPRMRSGNSRTWLVVWGTDPWAWRTIYNV